MHILVTGASGFVGSALVTQLAHAGHVVRAAVRTLPSLPAVHERVHVVGGADLSPATDWRQMTDGIDVVVHCAARVHVMEESAADPLSEFRRINVEATLALARQALKAGVKRFIFLSSIKVNGERTEPGQPFTADGIPRPSDPYGISKLEAEQALMALAAHSAMEVVVIRPVLVYGAGVKANFRSMMRWLDKGIPLPLGAITSNRRSLVALENLVDLISVCLDHPAAANEIFLVSDGEDLSTTELLRRMAHALGKNARLVPVPPSWIKLAARLVGRQAVAQRLCDSLQVDIGKTQRLLHWSPVRGVDEAFRLMSKNH